MLLTEKTRRLLRAFEVAAAVAAAVALLSSSFCETALAVVVAVVIVTASAAVVASFFFFDGTPKCFTAPESIFENQKRFSEFIATLAARQSARASAGMFFPPPPSSPFSPPPPTALPGRPEEEERGRSGSGSLISARQELQNSSANLSPKTIRATKKLDTMARPHRVYARLFLPLSPPAAESAQRR